jgi:hypothetical protein
MLRTENRLILEKKNEILYKKLMKLEREGNFLIKKEVSKSGEPTLKVNYEGANIYLHSKYNPTAEAERFVKQFDDITDYEHIFFIGSGLGYHLRDLLQKNKSINFSIFEPNIEVLFHFLTEVNLESLGPKRIKHIFSDLSEVTDLYNFVEGLGNKNTNIIFPISEKISKTEIDYNMNLIRDVLKDKKSTIMTNAAFQKRWIINSIKNFPKLLKTPNILMDIDVNDFKGKPVILVAAGPSLSYEYEHLKYIKDHGLAYIFSVGSAINSLIENDIYPNATLSYDPTEGQYKVLAKLKAKKIDSVPLIFGSTVGFETLEDYPGSMVHMITSQDTVSANLLDTSTDIDIVLDAPSIAIVTFQLLTLLQVSEIILVGQNFSYLDNRRYANGIEYDFVENELSDEEKREAIEVENIDGKFVSTSEGFLRMKTNLEYHIQQNPFIPVINTTQKGAKIKGTSYKLLKEVIHENLQQEHITHENWFNKKSSYDVNYVQKQLELMNEENEKIVLLIEQSSKVLSKIKSTLERNSLAKLEKLYVEFDLEFNKLKQNKVYSTILEPMIRVQNEILANKSKEIKFEQNTRKKARLVIDSFYEFINVIRLNYEFVKPIFEEFMKEMGVPIEEN